MVSSAEDHPICDTKEGSQLILVLLYWWYSTPPKLTTTKTLWGFAWVISQDGIKIPVNVALCFVTKWPLDVGTWLTEHKEAWSRHPKNNSVKWSEQMVGPADFAMCQYYPGDTPLVLVKGKLGHRVSALGCAGRDNSCSWIFWEFPDCKEIWWVGVRGRMLNLHSQHPPQVVTVSHR